MRKGVGLPQCLLLAMAMLIGAPAFSQKSQNSSNQAPKRLRSAFLIAEGYRDYNHRFYLNTRFGFGTFQSVVIPLAGGDPEAKQPTLAEHSGMPLGIGIGDQFKLMRTLFDFELNYLNMFALSSSEIEDQKNAGLSQIDLDVDAQILLFDPIFIELGVFGQRTHFKNGSSGHAADAYGPQAGLGALFGKRWQLLGRYRQALDTQFGYNDGGFSNRRLAGSKAEYRQVAGELSWGVLPRAHLVFTLVQEETQVTIPDIGAYQEFGLDVIQTGPRDRVFTLNTQYATLGFLKSF